MTSVLSPLAEPFHPYMGQEVNSIIYNDGIPSLSFYGSDTEFLHMIDDEAIDEAYPPTAEEAAELEAVETFVEMMATLAYLEEKEEATRKVYSGLAKRWQARRELVGRPKPARHLVKPVIHNAGSATENMKDLVVFDHSNVMEEHRMRQRELSRMAKANMMVPKKNKKMMMNNMMNHYKPIQQPRKNS